MISKGCVKVKAMKRSVKMPEGHLGTMEVKVVFARLFSQLTKLQ